MSKKILSSFFRGLLLVAPLALTAYVLYAALGFVDGLIPVRFPGLGILIVLSAITLIGALSQTLLIDPIIGQLEKVVNRVPLAALIYSSVKDLLSAFVGDKRKFEQPVLVEILPGSGLQKIGFVTQSSLPKMPDKELMAIYFPDSYNISGEVLLVPGDRVKALDWKSADAMKFVLSGGVAYQGATA